MTDEMDPIDEMVAVLREALAANDLTLRSPSTHDRPYADDRALDMLARGLLARRVAEPSRVRENDRGES